MNENETNSPFIYIPTQFSLYDYAILLKKEREDILAKYPKSQDDNQNDNQVGR